MRLIGAHGGKVITFVLFEFVFNSVYVVRCVRCEDLVEWVFFFARGGVGVEGVSG